MHVFLTNEGFIKVADHGILHEKRFGYLKALAATDRPFLSPQQLKSLQKKEPNPRGDQFKNDIFSLGVLMLEAATLLPSEFVYNWSKQTVNYAEINKSLQQIRLRHSEFLTNIIAEMLNEDENARPSFHDLNEILSPYEVNIREMRGFGMGPQIVPMVPQQIIQVRQSSPIREISMTSPSSARHSFTTNQQQPTQVIQASPKTQSPMNSQFIQQQTVPYFGRTTSPRTSLSPVRVNPSQQQYTSNQNQGVYNAGPPIIMTSPSNMNQVSKPYVIAASPSNMMQGTARGSTPIRQRDLNPVHGENVSPMRVPPRGDQQTSREYQQVQQVERRPYVVDRQPSPFHRGEYFYQLYFLK
jgi:hypothetical protein